LIGLISPTLEEGRILLRDLRKVRNPHLPFHIYQGGISDIEVIHIISGIGKANAAMATAILIERFDPSIIILYGIAGAYPMKGLITGDVAIAEKEIYGDEGVLTPEGFYGTEFIGIPLLKKGRRRFFNEFPLNKGLIRRAKRYIKRQLICGNFVTVSTSTGKTERGIELRNRYDAICENMEGAAVAQVCEAFGKGLIEIRGVSNIVEDRDTSRWRIEEAVRASTEALFDILNGLSQSIPHIPIH